VAINGLKATPVAAAIPLKPAELPRAFKTQLTLRGRKATVRANQSGCFDQCEHGPTVVVYPKAVRCGNVKTADVAEIVESHIVGDRPVKRLRLPDSCVNTNSCGHRPPNEK
jgi:(2Fe-2S) ferredoxin